MPYPVQTEAFEGPFDLLLHLILREEVELYEICLSGIVDAYLAELAHLESLDLEVATEFLLIASILVELKTKRLLPDDGDVDLEDEFGLWEHRDLLLSRLVECKTFKDASRVFEGFLADASRSFARRAGPDEKLLALAPDILEGVNSDDLRRAFFSATRPRPEPRLDLDHITSVRATVTEAIAEIVDEVRHTGRATFRQLTESLVERLEIVVRFLAVLELYKQGLVDLDQVTSFGEIAVSWVGESADRGPVELELVDAYEG